MEVEEKDKIVIKNYYDNIKGIDQSKLKYDLCNGCGCAQDDVYDDTGLCLDCLIRYNESAPSLTIFLAIAWILFILFALYGLIKIIF